tara:strand:+ start:361 stop:591 length:231 start_codon:yes stop_codon:yes gene_type:complete
VPRIIKKNLVKRIKREFDKRSNSYLLIKLSEKDSKKITEKTNIISNLLGKRVDQNKKGLQLQQTNKISLIQTIFGP